MKRRAYFCPGASRLHFQRGFTLLEMCTVLFIIILLMGVMMPAIESAFVEQGVRGDAHQLSLMVKTAMLQSTEQHRPYQIDVTATTMALHPLGETPKEADPDATPATSDDKATVPTIMAEDVVMTSQLDHRNQLLAPDPKKTNGWMAMPATSWLFRPGELCPAPRVRLARGEAWVEMSFNALTGNVENEAANFP
jgi:competence protein ComGC